MWGKFISFQLHEDLVVYYLGHKPKVKMGSKWLVCSIEKGKSKLFLHKTKDFPIQGCLDFFESGKEGQVDLFWRGIHDDRDRYYFPCSS